MGLKRNIIYSVMRKSREKKLNQLLNYLKPTKTDLFLDVGASNNTKSPVENYVIMRYPYQNNITTLSIYELPQLNKDYPHIKTVIYDGNIFPFKDKQFDLVHSNAVIEHVGEWERQKFFLSEMNRVSRKGFLTTPNKFFPFELHYKVPFLHWMDNKKFKRIADKYIYDMSNFPVSLLRKKDLIQLAEETGLPNYIILNNRFLGMNMTFTLLWSEKSFD